jgi:hypothetical protein
VVVVSPGLGRFGSVIFLRKKYCQKKILRQFFWFLVRGGLSLRPSDQERINQRTYVRLPYRRTCT